MRAEQFAWLGPSESSDLEDEAVCRYKEMYRGQASVLGGAILEPHAPLAAWWVALPKAVRPIAGAVRRAISGRSMPGIPLSAAETPAASAPPFDPHPPSLPGGGAIGAVAQFNPSGRPATPARGRPQRGVDSNKPNEGHSGFSLVTPSSAYPNTFVLRLPLAGLAASFSRWLAGVVRSSKFLVPRAGLCNPASVLRVGARVATHVALAAPERALIRIAVGVLCRVGLVAACGLALGAATYLLSQGRGWGG